MTIPTWSRRRLAVLCATLGIVGTGALLPVASRLDRARQRHAELSALSHMPLPRGAPLVAPGLAYHGAASTAAATLRASIRDLATREGALVERIDPRPAPAPGLVGGHAVLSGSARTMLRLIEAVETRTLIVRLPRYRLATTASGRSLRLEADFVMAVAAP